jgi:hypothetical protein
METKICTSCKVEKDITQFGKYFNRGKEYRRCTCHSCRNKSHAKRYKDFPEVRERMKKTAKEASLKRQYDMTSEDYNKMYAEQNGKCKICGVISNKTLNIDHCHTTNKVRGLLCWNCNIALGYFKDSILNLENAIIYLKN